MSKPTSEDIAHAIGITPKQVHQLHKRGMPTNTVKKAREWFEVNGFKSLGRDKGNSKGG